MHWVGDKLCRKCMIKNNPTTSKSTHTNARNVRGSFRQTIWNVIREFALQSHMQASQGSGYTTEASVILKREDALISVHNLLCETEPTGVRKCMLVWHTRGKRDSWPFAERRDSYHLRFRTLSEKQQILRNGVWEVKCSHSSRLSQRELWVFSTSINQAFSPLKPGK